MAYTSTAPGEETLTLYAFDDEFDPLAVDDTDINQEWMDDENPYDTIDYPTLRNMPEVPQRDAVFTPARQGSVGAALRALCRQNPSHRRILMGIVGLAEGGCASSVIAENVTEWMRDNRSVYVPMTLCRMLERAGALTLEMPETTEVAEDVEDGVAYLSIKETVDPVWHATDEALAVRRDYESGDGFRSIVMESEEARYGEVYAAVMGFLDEAPRSMTVIEALTDTFPITKSPKRYGQHFMDVLQATDCAVWTREGWKLTDLGRAMFAELQAVKEA